MDFIEIMFMAFGSLAILAGIASLVTGKIYLAGSEMGKYTEKSLRRYAPVWSVCNILCGLGIIAFQLFKHTTAFAVGSVSVSIGLLALAAAFVVITAIYTGTKSILVRK